MKRLLAVLALVFLLRLPSLFEPNWYGDEGIYLILGKVINQGGILYRDIWDNKTPLLYFLYAIFPVLWFAKILALLSVLGACAGVFCLTKVTVKKFAALTALIAGVFLSIPYFEGTIANAELFFVLPIVWGAFLLISNTRLLASKLLTVGILCGIAFLFKVPALLDFLGMFVFLFVFLFEMLWNKKKVKIYLKTNFEVFGAIGLGFLIPVGLSFLYFYANHALGDFLMAAFFQNASYVEVGSGALSKLSNPLFVRGGLLALTAGLSIIMFLKKKISKELFFLILWFGFSLLGALLSNRPYRHYLLQVVPPATVLLIYLLVNFRKYFVFLVFVSGVILAVLQDFGGAFRLQTIPYYKNFFDFVAEKKTRRDYVSFFDKNALTAEEIAEFVQKNSKQGDSIFIWDDAANIYVLSERKPATKFIQAHHLTTVEPSNYELVSQRLNEVLPQFILVKKNSRFKFLQLDEIVARHYRFLGTVGDLLIYKLKFAQSGTEFNFD